LILIDRNVALLTAAVNDLKKRYNVAIEPITADLGSYKFNRDLFSQIFDRIKEITGDTPIVGLINNIGVGYIEKFDKIPLE
jgi:short-subunit dehydrogenase